MLSGDCYFKYTARLDFLANGLFRFTQPSQLNDPLECNPQILMEIHSPEDIEEAKEQARKMGMTSPADIEKFLPMLLATGPKGRFTPEEYPGIPYPAGISSMAELDEQNAKKRLTELLTHINETYGIFCVSESGEEFLMWSHYADAHKGVVVGFDAKHPFFNATHDFYPVEYSDQRISLSSNNGFLRLAGYGQTGSHYKDLPVRLFLRKSKDWTYEREWRMIRKLDESELSIPASPPVYLFQVPRQAIKVIILGAQISPENAEIICKAVSNPSEWSHVQLFQATLARMGYGLEIRSYKGSVSLPAK